MLATLLVARNANQLSSAPFPRSVTEQRWLRSLCIFSAHAAIYTHSGGLPPAKTEHFSGNMILDPRLRKLYLLLDKRLHLVGVSHILLCRRRNLDDEPALNQQTY